MRPTCNILSNGWRTTWVNRKIMKKRSLIAAVSIGMFMLSAMTMAFIMSVVTVLFMQFFIAFEHCDNMRHWSMPEGCKIEMDDHKCTEENPEEDVDHIRNLYTADQINRGAKEIGIPEKKPGYDLNGDEGCHDHEI